MKIDIANIDKFVEVNSCPMVSNPIYIDTNRYPTSDGLFSNELFGIPGSYDRKTIFGYIDLKRHFLHPIVYKMLTSMDKRIKYIVDGSKKFTINKSGELIEDSENGNTGLSFLYSNWNKLKFKTTDSRTRDEKIDLMDKLKKDEVFVSKWLVIPAFYRDINFSKAASGKLTVDEINTCYSKLISVTNSFNNNSDGFDFMGSLAESKVQLILVEIYETLTQSLAKKNGYIRKYLLGKSIDYAVRSVISAPTYNTEKFNEQKLDFVHTGVPLSQFANLFFPLVIKEMRDFLEEELNSVNFVYTLDPGKKPDMKNLKKVYLKKPMEDYSLDNLKKLLNVFIKSPEDRFMTLKVNTEQGYLGMTLYYEDLGRLFTLTDLLYLSCYKIAQDKHVYITRYPIEHHQNIYPSKIFLLSTYKTKVQKLGNKFFEDYPDIYPDYPIEENQFRQTILLNNSCLEALGGDYDGDMISIRGVFSQEANTEAEEMIYSKKNILNSNGNNIRKLKKESVLTIYTLTKD